MSLQDQLEQNDRAHAIRVTRLQQQIAQADDQAEVVNQMKHDELQLKVWSGAAQRVGPALACARRSHSQMAHRSAVSGSDGNNTRGLERSAREMSHVAAPKRSTDKRAAGSEGQRLECCSRCRGQDLPRL